MKKVLFVCLGNICRSPAAEGVMKAVLKKNSLPIEVHVASCGMGKWHVGEFPDPRMRKSAKEKGFILDSTAQQFEIGMFDTYDYILSADRQVLEDLKALIRLPENLYKLYLINDFNDQFRGKDIPDPYWGEAKGFDEVIDILEIACEGLLEQICKDHSL